MGTPVLQEDSLQQGVVPPQEPSGEESQTVGGDGVPKSSKSTKSRLPKNEDGEDASGDEDEADDAEPYVEGEAGAVPADRDHGAFPPDRDRDAPQSKKKESPSTSVQERSPLKRFIRFNQKLGSGALKTVYLGCDTDTGREVAWNVISVTNVDPIVKKRIHEEINMLKSLDHPRIIRFINAWINKKKKEVCFITELVTGGSLLSYIKMINNPIKLRVMRPWCRQILDGLCYLHHREEPIIHRDLKCDNIFIDSIRGDVLIGDLGLSTRMKKTCAGAQSIVGTPEFIAPEVYDEKYDTAVDIYAFGMCLLEMVTRASPYEECKTVGEVYRKVLAGEQPRALGRIQDTVLKEIVTSCTRQDPKQRPTAKALLEEKEGAWFQVEEADKDMVCKLIPLEQVPVPEEVHESMCPPGDAPLKLEEVAEASAVSIVGHDTATTVNLTLASQMQDAPVSYIEPGLMDLAPSVAQNASRVRSQLDAQSPCVEPGPMNPAPSVEQKGSQAEPQQNAQVPVVEPGPVDPAPSIAQTAPHLQSQQNAQIPYVEPGQIDAAPSVAQAVSQVQSQQHAQALCVESGLMNPAPSVAQNGSQAQSQQNALVPFVESGPIDPAPSIAQSAPQLQSQQNAQIPYVEPGQMYAVPSVVQTISQVPPQQHAQVLCVESGLMNPAPSVGESASQVQSQQDAQLPLVDPGPIDPVPSAAQTVSQVQSQHQEQVLRVESGPTDPTSSASETASKVQSQQRAQVQFPEPGSTNTAQTGLQVQMQQHAPVSGVESGPTDPASSVGGSASQVLSQQSAQFPCGEPGSMDPALAGGESSSHVQSQHNAHAPCIEPGPVGTVPSVAQMIPSNGAPNTSPGSDVQSELQPAVSNLTSCDAQRGSCLDAHTSAQHSNAFFPTQGLPQAEASTATHTAASEAYFPEKTDFTSAANENQSYCSPHDAPECTTMPAAAPEVTTSSTDALSDSANAVTSVLGREPDPFSNISTHQDVSVLDNSANTPIDQKPPLQGDENKNALADFSTSSPAAQQAFVVEGEQPERGDKIRHSAERSPTHSYVTNPTAVDPNDAQDPSLECSGSTDEELRKALERAGEEVISTVTMSFRCEDRPSYSVEFDFDPKHDKPQEVAKELQEHEIAPKEIEFDELQRLIKRAVIDRCDQMFPNRDQQQAACHGEVCQEDSKVPQTDELVQSTNEESLGLPSDSSRAALANEPAEVRNASLNPLPDDESASVQLTTDEETAQPPRLETLGWDKQQPPQTSSLSPQGTTPPDGDKMAHTERHSALLGDKGVVDTNRERIEDEVKKKDEKEKKKFEEREEDKKKKMHQREQVLQRQREESKKTEAELQRRLCMEGMVQTANPSGSNPKSSQQTAPGASVPNAPPSLTRSQSNQQVAPPQFPQHVPGGSGVPACGAAAPSQLHGATTPATQLSQHIPSAMTIPGVPSTQGPSPGVQPPLQAGHSVPGMTMQGKQVQIPVQPSAQSVSSQGLPPTFSAQQNSGCLNPTPNASQTQIPQQAASQSQQQPAQVHQQTHSNQPPGLTVQTQDIAQDTGSQPCPPSPPAQGTSQGSMHQHTAAILLPQAPQQNIALQQAHTNASHHVQHQPHKSLSDAPAGAGTACMQQILQPQPPPLAATDQTSSPPQASPNQSAHQPAALQQSPSTSSAQGHPSLAGQPPPFTPSSHAHGSTGPSLQPAMSSQHQWPHVPLGPVAQHPASASHIPHGSTTPTPHIQPTSVQQGCVAQPQIPLVQGGATAALPDSFASQAPQQAAILTNLPASVTGTPGPAPISGTQPSLPCPPFMQQQQQSSQVAPPQVAQSHAHQQAPLQQPQQLPQHPPHPHHQPQQQQIQQPQPSSEPPQPLQQPQPPMPSAPHPTQQSHQAQHPQQLQQSQLSQPPLQSQQPQQQPQVQTQLQHQQQSQPQSQQLQQLQQSHHPQQLQQPPQPQQHQPSQQPQQPHQPQHPQNTGSPQEPPPVPPLHSLPSTTVHLQHASAEIQHTTST